MADDVLQRIELNVPASRGSWTDSGMILAAGDVLRVVASGAILIDGGDREWAFPEGRYPDDTTPTHPYEPENAVEFLPGDDTSRFPASNVRPWSLALALRPGMTPPESVVDGDEPIDDALQGDRNVTFDTTTIGDGGRLWLILNDLNTDDNHGAFAITLEKLGTADPLYPGTVSPIRLVPLDVYREKQKSIENTAVCWFIRPKYDPPEGYTEMDFPIECPEIQLPTGADDDGEPLYTVIPALTYEPFSGLSITGVPTTVKLGVDAPDVTVINFDQAKLRREYYEESQVEVFEIALDGDHSKPMLYLSGVLGNCEGDALSATIELTPYDELTNLPVGWKMGFLCDVGRLPGEEFGTMRCTNLKKLDGIDIADWTRGARIDSIISLSRLVLVPESVSGFDGFESDFPGSYGIIQFMGGELDGLRRDVGKFDPATGIINLRRALPMLPEADATMIFKAGCDRTFDGGQGCLFWQQGRNFRNTPHLPGRKALRRSISI